MMFEGIHHYAFQKYIEERWREETSLTHSNCELEPFSDLTMEENCTAGRGIQLSDCFDKFLAHVEFLHCSPECLVPYSVEGFLKIYKDMVQVLLVLFVFFTQNTEVENLFRSASSPAEPCLFLSDDLFCLGSESVQEHYKHYFACMTYEANCSVV